MRARVEGQLFPGTVSMMRPLVAPPEVVGLLNVGERGHARASGGDDEGVRHVSALRIGWIGLGAMGAPMAACAAGAGFDVVAYDVDAERGAAIALQGATSAATAAEDADVLALMVATPEQVEERSVRRGRGGRRAPARCGARRAGGLRVVAVSPAARC